MSSSVSATSAGDPSVRREEILPVALLLVLLFCDAPMADDASR
jgi:hypothetical protein